MLGLLALFLPLDRGDDLVLVLLEEVALEHHVARGEVVLGPLAGRANLRVGIRRCGLPAPAAVLEARVARRAARGLRWLLRRPVGIVRGMLRRVLRTVLAVRVPAFGFHGVALSPRSSECVFTSPRWRSSVSWTWRVTASNASSSAT